MDDFERTEAGNLTGEGIRQYLLAKFNRVTKIKDERIKNLEALRDTVSINCKPPADCNDPKVLKTYMKACFDEAEKLYD